MIKSKKRADAGYLELMISLIISLALGLVLITGSKGIMRGTEGTNLVHQLHNELTTQVVNAPFQRGYDTDNLVKIYLDYDSINLYVTQKKQITYALKGPDGCDKTITWKSLNPNIASVDNNGTVTGVSPGDTVVYATTSTKVRAKCSVHVDPRVTITINPTELNLRVGAITDYTQIKYTLNPSNPVNNLITWNSTNADIASVDNKGYVTPKQPGDTVITGKTYTGNYAQCKVHVTRVWRVALTANGNGTVSGSGIYPEGSSVKIIAVPKNGYQLQKWSDGNTSATRLISVTQNINLTAYFGVNGITWTYGITHSGHFGDQFDAYGVNEEYSSFVEGYLSDCIWDFCRKSCSVTYTFNNGNGFMMHKGQNIRIYYHNGGNRRVSFNVTTYVNGSYIADYDNSKDGSNYIFGKDTLVKTIKIGEYIYNNDDNFSHTGYASGSVVIHSDYGSFLLNNSGTSKQ